MKCLQFFSVDYCLCVQFLRSVFSYYVSLQQKSKILIHVERAEVKKEYIL